MPGCTRKKMTGDDVWRRRASAIMSKKKRISEWLRRWPLDALQVLGALPALHGVAIVL